MTFDPSITMGAVLNAGVLLVGFVVAFTRIGGRIDLLAQRLKAVEEALKQSSDIDRRLATLEERVTNHVKLLTIAQQEISDMRHGKGFITGNRHGVNGEYSS
ncbi:MAG: hypothetical protein KGL62_10030 [Bradyrhizobium sp.]|uniref:hypothetical protein n=1 Tax=Bradyrhizobium sp. TaxID=376 RepID=UPI00239BFA86|nr:hypothetical protein [Bradyrhizobium sp.]MDE2602690.1 hypothetical protein [Bradyrhizobium sp.]